MDLLAEAFDSFFVGFALDLLEDANGLLFGIATDDETVESKFDLAFATILLGSVADVGDLRLEAFEGVSIHAVKQSAKARAKGQIRIQVVIRDSTSIILSIITVATLEDDRVRAIRQRERLGLQRIVVELVEISLVGELLLGPNALEALDELATAAIAFGLSIR